jgi:hypothetical protein
MWVALILGALGLLFVLNDTLRYLTFDGSYWDVWAATGVVGAFLIGGAGLLVLYEQVDRGIAVAAVVLTALLAYGTYSYKGRNDSAVEDYCYYGATSGQQAEHCIEEVEPGYVRYIDTQAGQYATGELDECGSEAGPLCENHQAAEEAEDAAAEAGY